MVEKISTQTEPGTARSTELPGVLCTYNVDPESYLGLHCLHDLSVQILRFLQYITNEVD